MRNLPNGVRLMIVAAFFLILSGCFPDTTSPVYQTFSGQYRQDYHGEGYRIDTNTVTLKFTAEINEITGTGKVVITRIPAYEGDSSTVETYNLEYSGKYDVNLDGYKGLVHITGGCECVLACEGVDDYTLDYYAEWTARLVEYDQAMDGKSDYGAFDFYVTKTQ